MTTARRIEDFLEQKRLAIVGVSRNKQELSRKLFHEFLALGYDAVPVNPHTDELEERVCYESVSKITPPVDGALLMTTPAHVNPIVGECLLTGVPRVWIAFSAGPEALDPDLARRCRESGMSLIIGFCPYMFLPGSGLFHRLHGWFAKRSKMYRSE